ncbi:MAG: tetratricopeptide repeat protein, partial [Candidatus Latescibacterota bacterium]
MTAAATDRPWRDGGLILLCCCVVYFNAFPGAFHYDDFHSLVENPAVRSLRFLPGYFTDPSLFSADAGKAMYRPLLLVTYALNHALGGYRPAGYLAVNLGLHLACSLLVWALGVRLLGSRSAGLFSGLLFALHPLATEPVNYISSRSESLAACGYLGAFLLHLQGRDRSSRGYLAAGAYGLGLLAKSVAITAPAVFWLHDRWVRREPLRRTVYLTYGLIGSAYLLLITANSFLTRSLAHPVRSWDHQLWTQAKAAAYYLRLLVLPTGLSVEPQFFAGESPWHGPVLAGLALVASLALVGWLTRRSGLPAFCLTWAGLVILPATVMPLNMLVNQRRLYLAVAALAWLGGWLLLRRRGWLLWVCLPLLAVLTIERNPVWRSELNLWQDAAAKGPAMYRVQTNLGKALQQSGDPDGAMRAYARAIALDQGYGDAYNNIATLLHLRGEVAAAVPWYRQALERYPDYEEIHQNLADAYAQLGQLDSAAVEYRRALAIDDRSGSIWSNYGQTLYRAGHLAEAEAAWQRAVQLLPDRAEPYNNLGNLYGRQGEYQRAVTMYEAALTRGTEQRAEVLVNLADTFREMGEVQRARAAVAQALEADPSLAMAHHQLGRIERQAGHLTAAEAALARAVSLDSTALRYRLEWAEVLAALGRHREATAEFRRVREIDPGNSRAWFGSG